ncbi:MAG TPA: hypothetical protein VFO16_05630 [Pseudonocardiaceae bacterium]|nr:hypothetical protein [Pseudonocardiaceae bacterium]
MSRIATWIGRNADGLVALLLAACIAILAWADVVGTNQVNSAILLILAVLATTLLRDRVRTGIVERDVQRVCELVETLDTKVTRAQQDLEQSSTLRILRGDAIGEALAEARRDTDIWMFKGGTGTFIRAVTLPECIQRARENGRALTVRLEILDPTDDELCEHYATLQRSMSRPGGGGELWTIARTKKESFATILAACWHAQRYRPLTVEIGLASTISTFRWDLSSRSMVMTTLNTAVDKQEPGLLIERGSLYYDRHATELRTSFDQSRRLPIAQTARAVPLGDEPSIEEVQKVFVSLNVPLPSSFDDGAISEIIQKAIQAKNPYSRL